MARDHGFAARNVPPLGRPDSNLEDITVDTAQLRDVMRGW
jgi:hypothetical protein